MPAIAFAVRKNRQIDVTWFEYFVQTLWGESNPDSDDSKWRRRMFCKECIVHICTHRIYIIWYIIVSGMHLHWPLHLLNQYRFDDSAHINFICIIFFARRSRTMWLSPSWLEWLDRLASPQGNTTIIAHAKVVLAQHQPLTVACLYPGYASKFAYFDHKFGHRVFSTQPKYRGLWAILMPYVEFHTTKCLVLFAVLTEFAHNEVLICQKWRPKLGEFCFQDHIPRITRPIYLHGSMFMKPFPKTLPRKFFSKHWAPNASLWRLDVNVKQELAIGVFFQTRNGTTAGDTNKKST